MNDLFYIAYQDELTMIRIEEDKLFLVKQREKGRPGSMLGVDIKLTNIEKRKQYIFRTFVSCIFGSCVVRSC
jgi:hypothetical protein